MSYTKHRSLFTHPVRLLFALALSLAPILGLASRVAQAASGGCITSAGTVTCTFNYTGAAETWIVPAGVTSVTIQALGAQGARGINGFGTAGAAGGLGGAVTATITATPGETLFVYVGGTGVTGGAGGFNGGSAGIAGVDPRASGGGGGASDVRQGGNALANRVVVAGGGGGGGASDSGGAGGAGGNTTGAAGSNSAGASGGGGGTQAAGGTGGTGNPGADGANGVLGIGGAGGTSGEDPGGGGGGGYYGGGGGEEYLEGQFGPGGSAGGGGGSAFTVGGATGVTHQQGVRTGNGQVIISYSQADTTAPTITISSPGDGAVYLLGQSVAASYACQDESGGSGLASCIGTVTTGAPVDTATVGSHSFSVQAADNAGNTASKSVTYQVVYNWSGFFQPIDNLPTVNSVKAGSAVPVKFSLSGNYGLNIFAQGYPKVQQVACGSGAPTDEVEQTVTAGASGLSYDATTNMYSYTWKTDKKWAGSCRQLVLKLIEGSEHIASFTFK